MGLQFDDRRPSSLIAFMTPALSTSVSQMMCGPDTEAYRADPVEFALTEERAGEVEPLAWPQRDAHAVRARAVGLDETSSSKPPFSAARAEASTVGDSRPAE